MITFTTFTPVNLLQVKHYRFSISWSRIFLSGTKDSYNPDSMQYYKNVTEELVKNGIVPMATLYHWDLPQPPRDVGGCLNNTVIAHFRDYTDVCFKELGDKVWYKLSDDGQFNLCKFHLQFLSVCSHTGTLVDHIQRAVRCLLVGIRNQRAHSWNTGHPRILPLPVRSQYHKISR